MPPFNKPKVSTLGKSSLAFTLLFKHYLLFERHFHTTKGKETLSRSCNNLNTIDDNVELTESFSTSTELHNVPRGIYGFCF
jgi:hypothetical protein